MTQIYTQISHVYQTRRLVTALGKPLKASSYSPNIISSLKQTIWNFVDYAIKISKLVDSLSYRLLKKRFESIKRRKHFNILSFWRKKLLTFSSFSWSITLFHLCSIYWDPVGNKKHVNLFKVVCYHLYSLPCAILLFYRRLMKCH